MITTPLPLPGLTATDLPADNALTATPADSVTLAQATYLSPQDSLTHRLYSEVQIYGKNGTPLPYRLQNDDSITAVALGCFFILAYVLSGGKHYLLQQIKNFFYTRERSNLFAEETNVDFNYRLLLILNSCLIGGMLTFDHIASTRPDITPDRPLYSLALYSGCFLIYYLSKSLLYTLINWIFFDKTRARIWYNSFFLLVALSGIVFYPLVLLVIYFDLSDAHQLLFVGICLVIEKILLFYKCTNIFFSNLNLSCHLIVYFCALEIIPCILLWRALANISHL